MAAPPGEREQHALRVGIGDARELRAAGAKFAGLMAGRPELQRFQVVG